jgi:hypothetical protein
MKDHKMDKTRVDDMLIEMIKPKIKEIEDKILKGLPVTHEELNTAFLAMIAKRSTGVSYE